MNQGGYFGAYQGGFQTLPKGAYEMMTAPNRMNAETIQKAASGISNMVQKYADQKAGSEASQQGAAVQYKGLEGLSQATGVPMNPELADQFKNMSSMSPQQRAVFNQSLGQEAQNMMTRYGINQAQARAGQAQGQMYKQDFQNSLVSAGYTPQMPIGQGGMPAFNPLFNVSPQPTPAQSYWNQSMGGR